MQVFLAKLYFLKKKEHEGRPFLLRIAGPKSRRQSPDSETPLSAVSPLQRTSCSSLPFPLGLVIGGVCLSPGPSLSSGQYLCLPAVPRCLYAEVFYCFTNFPLKEAAFFLSFSFNL